MIRMISDIPMWEVDLPNHRLVVYQNGNSGGRHRIISSSGTPAGVYTVQGMDTSAEVNGKQ